MSAGFQLAPEEAAGLREHLHPEETVFRISRPYPGAYSHREIAWLCITGIGGLLSLALTFILFLPALILLLIVGTVCGSMLWYYRKRRLHTLYVITQWRALVLQPHFFPGTKCYAFLLRPGLLENCDINQWGQGSIIFKRIYAGAYHLHDIGFLHCPDAGTLYHTMKELMIERVRVTYINPDAGVEKRPPAD